MDVSFSFGLKYFNSIPKTEQNKLPLTRKLIKEEMEDVFGDGKYEDPEEMKEYKEKLNRIIDMMNTIIQEDRDSFVKHNPQFPGMKTHRDRGPNKPKVNLKNTGLL